MSDKPYYLEGETEQSLLRGWVLRQMLRGAGWSALIVGGLLAVYVALRIVSGFLPPESKEAPSPYSYLEQPLAGHVRTV